MDTIVTTFKWLLFCFFFIGSLGGVSFFIRLMRSDEKRVEVHHRYIQVPVYYGPDAVQRTGAVGRPGDMAQDDPLPTAS